MNTPLICVFLGDDDGDGIPDYLDNDDDGDGIPDEDEGYDNENIYLRKTVPILRP